MSSIVPKSVYVILGDLWPVIVIFVVVTSIVRFASLRSRNQKIVYYEEFINLIFLIYLLLLFSLVTDQDMFSVSNNFIPFKEMLRYDFKSNLFIRNVLGNILLFIPFGAFISYYVKKINIFKVLLITLITSSTIETVQLKIGRSFDVDDIILNVVGGLIGFLIYKILRKIKRVLPGFMRNEKFLNVLAIVIFIILILLFLNYTGIWRFLNV